VLPRLGRKEAHFLKVLFYIKMRAAAADWGRQDTLACKSRAELSVEVIAKKRVLLALKG